MRKFADFLVNKRYWILTIILILTLISGFLAAKVEINTDMSRYLSEDSNMWQGSEIMNANFPETSEPDSISIRVMFNDLGETDAAEVYAQLESIPNVSYVEYDAEMNYYNKDNHTLFIVHTEYDYGTAEESSIETEIATRFVSYDMLFHNNDTQETKVPFSVIAAALAILLIILFVMSASWVEPILFIITIGIAVIINFGTNIFIGYTSDLTGAIGPILQLVLSMDYSIILMNRYRQKHAEIENKFEAMKSALHGSLTAIFSSSLTTVVGLLALLFMTFKIGGELGIVLAKGVFISMICVFAVLPTLILLCDKWIDKTKKRALNIPMDWAASFSYKFRYALLAIFAALFVSFYIGQGSTQIIFTEGIIDPLDDVFPRDNTIVMIYSNEDEANIDALITSIEEDSHIKSITGYTNTLGISYTAGEMAYAAGELGIEPSLIDTIYYSYFGGLQQSDSELSMTIELSLTIQEMIDYLINTLLNDVQFSSMFNEQTKNELAELNYALTEGIHQLKGENFSRLIIVSNYPDESKETSAFIENLNALQNTHLTKASYLIGSSAMVYEMEESFDAEFKLVSIITAAAIFIVVLLTFRSAVIPAMLVLLVQCGVFITVTVVGWQGYSIYYLALLIVQSILMGATIDYAIVFSDYYRESRKKMSIQDSLSASYNNSMHTFMTSGMILVVVTAVLGKFVETQTISQVCSTISIGSLCAVLLILFILPGILACFDRFITKQE